MIRKIKKITEFIKEGECLYSQKWYPSGVFSFHEYIDNSKYIPFRAKILSFLKHNFKDKEEFIKSIEELKDNYASSVLVIVETLKSIISEMENEFETKPNDIVDKILYNDILLSKIFNNFNLFVNQLRKRHDKRDAISVNDEYDVQDLVHSILKLFFEDIRSEEYTPSYAGGSARQDFLLKEEKIVVEIKMPRKNLNDRKLGEELLIDILKYSTHPDCNSLYCFIYDPNSFIQNPAAIKKDLEANQDKINVKIIFC